MGQVLTPELLTIRVLTPDPARPHALHGVTDQRSQYERVCTNALAAAIQRDSRPERLTVPQFIPAGLGTTVSARPSAATPGSVDAAAVLAAHVDAAWWEREARKCEEMQAWDLYDRAVHRQLRAMERVTRLTRTLESMDTAPRRQHGPSHLYLVAVPAVTWTGGAEGTAPEARHILDTHTLPDDLRAWLTGYAQSGTVGSPYKYKRTRERHWPNDKVPDDTRATLRAIWDHTATGRQGENAPPPQSSCAAHP